MNFHLPFINRIREAGRHLVLFVIGVSFLSGLGYCLLAQSLEECKERGNVRPLIAASGVDANFCRNHSLGAFSERRGPKAEWILDSGISADPVRAR